MKVFEENGKIRLQLMDLKKGVMLFDFTIEKEDYKELREHIIEHLNAFKLVEEGKNDHQSNAEEFIDHHFEHGGII